MTNPHEAARRGLPLLLLPVQTAVVAGLGLLVTGPLAHRWPLSAEDGVSRALAAHRTPVATALTEAASLLASTGSVIALTVLCAAALLVLPHVPRWREAAFLAVTVAAQSAVFLLVTLVVDRERPGVPHLDPAPPTSSFPSGHVGASVALFGGLAVLASRRLRGARRGLVVGLLLVIPLLVAASRVYRGMHHPSDVVVGLLNGACTLALVAAALLPGRREEAATPVTDPSAHGARRAVVVRHPHGCGDDTAARVRALLRDHGYAEQRWTETTAGDPSGGLASCLAGTEADLVVVCGGDGTVRACADVLAGTGTPLAIVPCGTGNLLARNLRLPTEPVAALREALNGQAAGLDVGRMEGDGIAPTRFAVMAGAGFDAAMVQDASARLKERLGWVAYAVSAVRHLGDTRMRLTIRLDGGEPLERRARMVVIGNVGTLQGGLPLLPEARPDSGRLEVVLLDPRGVTGWLAAAGYLASHVPGGRKRRAAGVAGERVPEAGERSLAHGALEYFGATRIDLDFARPQPRELDGDVFPAGTRLTAEVESGALRVYLPAPARALAPTDTGTPHREGALADAEVLTREEAPAATPARAPVPARAATPVGPDVPAQARAEGGAHGHRDARTAAK
ncbi:diacylglycerol kinase family protein [Streptomyces sp. NPDC048330]|uniref:diacylglycerol kinase family protein n=1 Tax=Streptomyces sp. NPDC048330 TaxID=3365533 RepID=UPI0037227F7A